MTILGKILIFVNLVFSVVTGILIVMVFATRTNWKVGYDKLVAVNKVNEANVRTYADEVKAARTAGEAKAKQLSGEIAAAKVEIARLQRQFDDEHQQHVQEIQKAKIHDVSVAHASAELVQRRNEVATLKQQVESRDQQIIVLQTEKKDLRDAAVRADIAARTAHNRTKEFLETNERLVQENDRLKGGGSSSGTLAGRKPPEDVKGLVLDVDRSGLITISLGSDHGVTKGNELEVYRLSPEPKYLGKMRVSDANHHEAVGRMVSARNTSQIQKGDTVASSIIAH